MSANTSPTDNQANSAQMGKSKYITFLTDDDAFHPDYLKEMYRTITNSKADLIRAGGYYIDAQGQIIGDFLSYHKEETDASFIESRVEQRIISGHAGYIFTRNDYYTVGGLTDVGFAGSLYADDYLWFRLALKSGSVALAKEAIWYWRKHDNNVGSKLDLEKFISNTAPYIQKIEDLLPRRQDFDKTRNILKNTYQVSLIRNRLIMELARLKNIKCIRQYLKYQIKYRKYLNQKI